MDKKSDGFSWFEYAENDFETIINQCSDLTIYASEVRYPNILEIESYHMIKAIENVEIIR